MTAVQISRNPGAGMEKVAAFSGLGCGGGVEVSDSATRARPYTSVMQPGLRFHHVGIPTSVPRPGERYLPEYKLFVSGYETSAYGVEWMRFEPDSSIPDLVQRVPHVAFEVDDLAAAIAGKEVLIEPNSPSPGVTVAFIVDNGAPIEFLWIEKNKT